VGELQADFDSPWKEVLERYFEAFVAFFFPDAHNDIVWERGFEFLDKELQQVVRDAELGRRLVDKLVKVWRRPGDEAWVLVHVEVQGQEESAFAERMYVYNYRLFDRYRRQVASLAVLGDERSGWRPERFGYGLWGCEVSFRYPVVKLLDYRTRWQELEASRNPFAVAVMAHLKTQETRHDELERQRWKQALVRGLYERGFGREEVIDWFRFVDWLMKLPPGLEDRFWRELREYEEQKRMPYVTSVERIGYERGVRQGLLAGLELGLELRFGAEGLRLLPEISNLTDLATLRAIHEGLKVATTVDEVRRIYQTSN
jgi:hypothetical protein